MLEIVWLVVLLIKYLFVLLIRVDMIGWFVNCVLIIIFGMFLVLEMKRKVFIFLS